MSFYDDHIGIARDIKGIEERLGKLEDIIKGDCGIRQRLNEIENDLMRHQDKDRDWAHEITSQANKWIKETNERVKKLEAEKPTIDQIRRTYVFKKLDARIEKLEALHKTEKPAEFEGPSVQMTTEELEDMAERYEHELQEMFKFKKTKIIYKFAKHLEDVNVYAEMKSVKYFLGWLNKSGYKIREKDS